MNALKYTPGCPACAMVYYQFIKQGKFYRKRSGYALDL